MPRSVGRYSPHVYTVRYDFDTLGGAIGVIDLLARGNGNDDGLLADDTIIVGATLEVVKALTSDGAATIKLGHSGDDDCFVAATAFDNALFTVDTAKALTAAIPAKINVTAGVKPIATIAAAALTGGSFDIHIMTIRGH